MPTRVYDEEIIKEATTLFTKFKQRRKLPLPERSMLPEPSIKKAKSIRVRHTTRKEKIKRNEVATELLRNRPDSVEVII